MIVWLAIVALAVINMLIKAAGPALLGDRELPPPPALLAGLLIVQVLGQGWREFDWTLLPGLAVIGVLWAAHRSQVVCVVAGVVVTIAIRAVV